jgi:hypothetical protein
VVYAWLVGESTFSYFVCWAVSHGLSPTQLKTKHQTTVVLCVQKEVRYLRYVNTTSLFNTEVTHSSASCYTELLVDTITKHGGHAFGNESIT